MNGQPLRYLSLFSGIGGFDLGFDRAGMVCAGQVEFDEKAREVLAKHWPDVPRLNDVREVNGDEFGSIDLICGGFPCQPHSLAGKRRGSDDERDLWGEFFRIVCAVKPRWIVAENVFGLLSSENGRFFGSILRDLAGIGYDAEWEVLPASLFGAPHKRERVFLIASPSGITGERRIFFNGFDDIPRNKQWSTTKGIKSGRGWKRWLIEASSHLDGEISQSDFLGVDDGVSEEMDRIKTLGNAVVPQIAEWIGRRINELDAAQAPEFVNAHNTEVGQAVTVRAKNHAILQGVFTAV